MIDGVKIKCIGTTAHHWEQNRLLKFATKVDTETGQILSKNRVAFYRGLSFHLIPSTVSDAVHCILKGSFATFHNQGKDNAFDFTLGMLIKTIQELEAVFNIAPARAIVQAVEYGANISPKQTVRSIINGLRAYQSNNFTGLKMDNVFNGKQLDRYEYSYKIYDKGLQTTNPDTNLLRVEYAVKKGRQAQRFGIKVLADLADPENLHHLKTALLEVWGNVIFYDKGMRWRYMTDKEQKKMLFYLDATNWGKFTPRQRQVAKHNFQKLNTKFCTSTTQQDISELLTVKLDNLTAKTVMISPTFKMVLWSKI